MPDTIVPPTLAIQILRHSQNRSYEVLVIGDHGSPDGTADLALKLDARYPQSGIRAVILEKCGAIRHTARARTSGCSWDADGASSFEGLEWLWNTCQRISGGRRSESCIVGEDGHKMGAVVKVHSMSSAGPQAMPPCPRASLRDNSNRAVSCVSFVGSTW